MFAFITGGSKSEFIMHSTVGPGPGASYSSWNRTQLPFARGTSSGAFSVETGSVEVTPNAYKQPFQPVVVVGGDYKHPDSEVQTAAFSNDSGLTFQPAQTPPHGYRSSVAYDPTQKLWITVGPNGTDISTDDGKNWTPLKPSGYDPPDADKNWNALSLPFVVGPHGRIGRLRTITQK